MIIINFRILLILIELSVEFELVNAKDNKLVEAHGLKKHSLL
jgi:hypothetical protein